MRRRWWRKRPDPVRAPFGFSRALREPPALRVTLTDGGVQVSGRRVDGLSVKTDHAGTVIRLDGEELAVGDPRVEWDDRRGA